MEAAINSEKEVSELLCSHNVSHENKVRFAIDVVNNDNSHLYGKSKAASWFSYRNLESGISIDYGLIEGVLCDLEKDVDLCSSRWYLSLRTVWVYSKILDGCDTRGYCFNACDWESLRLHSSCAVNICRLLCLYCIQEINKKRLEECIVLIERTVKIFFSELAIRSPNCMSEDIRNISEVLSIMVILSPHLGINNQECVQAISEIKIPNGIFGKCFNKLMQKRFGIW
jgi:hypothetical protein